MKKIHLRLKENSYDIVIGRKNLSALGGYLKNLNIGQDAVVVTHPVIASLHGKQLVKGLTAAGYNVKIFKVPEGEKSKSAEVAHKLMERIARYDVMKRIFIVAFGGGVVGDLAGYVAAVYKRGVPYIQVPTTFLAQIDSAIGGKVAIDLSIGKNLVGAFYQPKVVWSDVNVLTTLSQRQLRNGLAEAVKYGIIDDPVLFSYLEKNHERLLKNDLICLEHVVEKSSWIKAKVVMADEKETKNIRTILNFGHTLGHAIEAAGKFKQYHHGEAIALGMRAASDISYRMDLINRGDVSRINALISHIGLPNKIRKLKISSILNLMKHDKKFISGKNRFVLAQKIGHVIVKEGISPEMIHSALVKLV